MNNLTIYPDKELRKQLKKKCEEENRSLNNLIITILKKYVESQGKPKKWKHINSEYAQIKSKQKS